MWVWHYRGGLQNEERRLYSQATVAAIDYHFYTETPVEFHLHWSVITIILSTMVTVVSNICFLVKHLLCSHVHTIYLSVREHSGQFINRHVHGVLCFKFPCYASDHRQVLRRFNHAKPNYGISLSVKLISTFRNQVLGYFWPMYYCAE